MLEPFPDRSDRLFGREAAIGALLARAGGKGITVVTGRARMGKTWTIQEVARRLIESGYLVGYREGTGGDSHALRTVSDL